MNSYLGSIFFLSIFISCVQKRSNSNNTDAANPVDTLKITKQDTQPITFDSTLMLFSDTTYKLTLHVFNTTSNDEEQNNTTVTFAKVQGNSIRRIFRDSFYCMYPWIERQDFNNDKVEDVLFFYYTGGRANPTYHLYLVDTFHRKLTYVKGFENLPNPALDTTKNIITSLALSGTNFYSFYGINPKGKLLDLGRSFNADLNDSVSYDKAIRAILRERRK